MHVCVGKHAAQAGGWLPGYGRCGDDGCDGGEVGHAQQDSADRFKKWRVLCRAWQSTARLSPRRVGKEFRTLDVSVVLQQIFNGLSLGSILLLGALGLAFSFG